MPQEKKKDVNLYYFMLLISFFWAFLIIAPDIN